MSTVLKYRTDVSGGKLDRCLWKNIAQMLSAKKHRRHIVCSTIYNRCCQHWKTGQMSVVKYGTGVVCSEI